MMNRKARTSKTESGKPLPTQNTADTAVGGGSGDGNWEMRPCGMLVQTRCDSDQNRPPPPTIRVRVKYDSVYHEISISSQASFGELKKMLTGPTGLHHEDQKLIFKDKERDSKAFLDTTGVKNKSKMVLIKDGISQEKRLLEMRRAAKLEKATEAISDISLEVDKLAGQVGALESVISRGGKVTENYVVNLIELLMNQLVKLDGVLENVDAKVQMQGKMQVKRVQNYVEILDLLKVKNSIPKGNDNATTSNKPMQNGNGNTASKESNITRQEKSSPTAAKQPERRLSDESAQSPVQKQQDRLSFGVPNQPQQRQPHQHVPSPVQRPQNRQPAGILKRPQQQLQQSPRHPFENGLSSPVQRQEEGRGMTALEQLLQPPTPSSSGSVVITTQWETFDSFPVHTSNHPLASAASPSIANGSTQPAFHWDLL